MTLPSRKKRQTTQPNMAQVIIDCLKQSSIIDCFKEPLQKSCFAKKATLASALLGSALCFSQHSIAVADETPLERLQNRSANERWREAAAEWMPVEETHPPLTESQTPLSESQSKDKKAEEPLSVKSETTEIRSISTSSEQTTKIVNKSDDVAEEFEIDTSFSLFEPFPGREKTKKTGISVSSSKTTSAARSFPKPVTRFSSDSGDQAQNLELPELSPHDELDFQPPAKSQEVAFLNQVPPAPQAESDLPRLRSISEIQPYHDYVPVSNLRNADRGFQPINTSGPEYLQLPAAGSLKADDSLTYYHWMASNLTHDPLYFEDVSLERYGHTYPLQPFVSISKFGLQVIGLPYQMALNPVDCEQYPLGYYRPGDCAPFLRYRIPFNKTAAATATGVYTGLFFLIP